MPLGYLENNTGAGLARMGQSFSQAAVGIAALRQQQQQQEYLNMLRMMQMEREDRLAGLRERLYGAQTEKNLAQGMAAVQDAVRLEGLDKTLNDVESWTFAEKLMADRPLQTFSKEEYAYTPARGAMVRATPENVASISQAMRRAVAERQALSSPSSAARRLVPFNRGQYGTITQEGEELAPALPRYMGLPITSRLVNVPTEATGVPTIDIEGTAREATLPHPSLIVARWGDELRAAYESGLDVEKPELFEFIKQKYEEAVRASGVSAAPSGISKYKVIEVK